MFGLRKAYNFPSNNTNVQNMSQRNWRHLVKSTLVRHAFLKLKSESAINETNHLEFVLLKPAAYLFELDPQFARVIFKVRTRLFDIKVNFKRKYNQDKTCPFCRNGNENIQHVFSCENGLRHKRSSDNTTCAAYLWNTANATTTTQKQRDYKLEQSFFTLIACDSKLVVVVVVIGLMKTKLYQTQRNCKTPDKV